MLGYICNGGILSHQCFDLAVMVNDSRMQMGPTPLIPLARTTTGLDSIRTKITTIGKEGLYMRIDAVVAKLTTIMELRTP